MTAEAPATRQRTTRVPGRDELPQVGDWLWVTVQDDEWDGKKYVKAPPREQLACVEKVGTNCLHLGWYESGDSRHASGTGCRVHFDRLLADTRPAPEWREVLSRKADEARRQLAARVKALALVYQEAGMDCHAESQDPGAGALVAVGRGMPPEAQRAALERVKETALPEAEKAVDEAMADLVAANENLVLPERAAMDLAKGRLEEVDARLFALKLYAGLAEDIRQIADGAPAPADTPVTIRQSLLYMDEETLIDYGKGGMDYRSLAKFDRWVAKARNRDRCVPEPRCVVAFKVRRHDKDYGLPRTLGELWTQLRDKQRNEWTYLLIRNGGKLYRLAAAIEFGPRLVPFRDEFTGPLVERERTYDWKKRDYRTTEREVTLADTDFDDAMKPRLDALRHHNRVMYLVQGLLDRTPVFAPHPPVNLSHPEDFERHVRTVRDEEDVLPSADVPDWPAYRDSLNATIQKGSLVWCALPEEDWGGYSRQGRVPKYGYRANRRPTVCEVERVAKDRKTVTLTWRLNGDTEERREIDLSRPFPGKPGYYYTRRVEYPAKPKYGHQRVPMDRVLAVEAYAPGDYKRFLCDRSLKGRYLEWAPQLLAAEDWHAAKAGRKPDHEGTEE